ncbi:MAG: hypothetical protein OXJ52_04900 [Oligoflexia bacterium]|nr:hypothetical protein [Oligoflexia bacterium]
MKRDIKEKKAEILKEEDTLEMQVWLAKKHPAHNPKLDKKG